MSNQDIRRNASRTGTLGARRVYSKLGIGHPTEAPIEILAQLRGLLIRYTDIDGAQARLMHTDSGSIAAVSSGSSFERTRFSVAHELGHYELHGGQPRLKTCNTNDMNHWAGSRTNETEANWFAAEFLMPKYLYEPRCDVGTVDLDIIEYLANEFQVSLTAAAIRFVTFTAERCCIVLSKAGKVLWAWPSSEFEYDIPNAPLDHRTLAYDYFSKRSVEPTPQPVSASSWIESDRDLQNEDVIEHSIALSSFHSVLSIVWIPPDADW